jgi:hypothetical protein
MACPCQHLHRFCDPKTCEAVERLGLLQAENIKTDTSTWAVESTLHAVRQAALELCRTCAIIYTGIQIAGDPKIKPDDNVDAKINVGYDGHTVVSFFNGFRVCDVDYYSTAKESMWNETRMLSSVQRAK